MRPRVIFVSLESARLSVDPYNFYKNKNYATNYGSIIEGNSDNYESLGVCALVLRDINEEKEEIYTEETMKSATERLRGADLVVGYNIRNFGFRLLSPYANYSLQRLPIFDLQSEIKYLISKRKGLRLPINQDKIPLISLANVSKWTLDREFSMFNNMPLLWEKGKQERVIEYITECINAIQGIFDHGCRHGAVSYFIYKAKKADILPTPLWKYKARSMVESEIPINYIDGQILIGDTFEEFFFPPPPEKMFALPDPKSGIKQIKESLKNHTIKHAVLKTGSTSEKLKLGADKPTQLLLDFS